MMVIVRIIVSLLVEIYRKRIKDNRKLSVAKKMFLI